MTTYPTCPMTTASRKWITPVAVAVELHCPDCEDADAIPSPDGSFMWDHFPEHAKCPECNRVFRVKRQATI